MDKFDKTIDRMIKELGPIKFVGAPLTVGMKVQVNVPVNDQVKNYGLCTIARIFKNGLVNVTLANGKTIRVSPLFITQEP